MNKKNTTQKFRIDTTPSKSIKKTDISGEFAIQYLKQMGLSDKKALAVEKSVTDFYAKHGKAMTALAYE